MSWLLFMDESGHDHRSMPYEVRGGIALHTGQLWSFVQNMKRLEQNCFGVELSRFKKEIKGSKLLKKQHFRWANQSDPLDEEVRRQHCLQFLEKSSRRVEPRKIEYTAYGQACLEMVRGVMQILVEHNASLFASAIPRGVLKPPTYKAEEYLRKDHVFLLERFYYFLDSKKEHGLLVMDEEEKTMDRKFVRKIERYFRQTATGRYRTTWIVPMPLFVSSDMVYPVQAADLCIYCINWGFRLPRLGMDAKTRPEIVREFRPWLEQLQFRGEGARDGDVFDTYGIVLVLDPYESRE